MIEAKSWNVQTLAEHQARIHQLPQTIRDRKVANDREREREKKKERERKKKEEIERYRENG